MTDLINIQLVRLDASWGADKADVIRGLAGVVNDADRADDLDQLIADAFAREETSSTGLPGGIAIPHCRTTGVSEPTLAFARLDPPVDFGAKDGPADLAFLIAAPAGGDATHLQLLTKLARSLVKPAFTDSLRAAETPEEVVELIDLALDEPAKPSGAHAAAPAPAAAAVASAASDSGASAAPAAKSLVAVTACPTGIAHTYMAAEALEAAAPKAGIEISVETQGSAGSTPLVPGHDRQRRRGDLRGRRRCAGPQPLRRQADGLLRSEAPDRRRRRDDRRGPALRRRPERTPRRGHGLRGGRYVRWREGVVRRDAPAAS